MIYYYFRMLRFFEEREGPRLNKDKKRVELPFQARVAVFLYVRVQKIGPRPS